MSMQAGIWNFDGQPADPKLLTKFGEAVKGRDSHGESSYTNGSLAMLFRPFHTTSEARKERQPYLTRHGLVLTWDGRLDNREELIGDLQDAVDVESTDVEIVAAAFELWQTESFRRIVGDWAISIWNPQQRELIFAIDYMAIRHIFYFLRKERIWWSTDLTSLVLLAGDTLQIDRDYI